jgi:hypothetical protein
MGSIKDLYVSSRVDEAARIISAQSVGTIEFHVQKTDT